MKNAFDSIGNFASIYDSQDAAADKKDGAFAAKEEQIEDLVSQLNRDKRDLSKKLKKSFLDSNMDSAGIAMDLEVIEKKLEYNKTLQAQLFA
jgi:predicted ATP-binding protein involved in virulence